MRANTPGARVGAERRVLELDGLRGLMTILVVVSHYFGELTHGLRAAMFGWIAVDMFFVLSGFLIGKLILEKAHHANFFTVFYVRRFCRIVPAYVLVLVAVWAFLRLVQPHWSYERVQFPLWSYLTFTQTFNMASANSLGVHALAPTWTLAFEEHFYLLAPLAMVLTPRRYLPLALGLVIAAAVGLRVAVHYFGAFNVITSLTMLPWRADILAMGILGAWAITEEDFPWAKLDLPLRIVPIVALVATLALKLADQRLFDVLNPLLIATGGVSFLLAIVRGAPEARRFRSGVLRFFGANSYCLYLVHLPLLWLAHGLLLDAAPDLGAPAQWAVTLGALPVCVLVGWGLTRLVEEPLTAYGRRWRWSAEADRLSRAALSPGLRPRP